MSDPIIILFEDDDAERPEIEKSIRAIFPDDVALFPFTGGGEDVDKPYETRLLNALETILPNTFLIMCDQDLSRLPGYQGLSANVVTSVAHDRSVPIALYGRGQDNQIFARMRRKSPFLERRFMLNFDPEEPLEKFAEQAKIFYNGCREIFDFMRKTSDESGGRVAGSPAKWLSEKLEAPEIQPALALYGSGDQQYLQNLAFTNDEAYPEPWRMVACEISYWLWDSILRFPGILLCQTAAESFMNLEGDLLSQKSIADLFERARYVGPFHEFGPYWWRHRILEILDEEGSEDGLAYVVSKLGEEYASRASKCCEDPAKSAGAFCMLSNQPVSFENSFGDIPYFPSGADLARISKSAFDRVAPWAGLDSIN